MFIFYYYIYNGIPSRFLERSMVKYHVFCGCYVNVNEKTSPQVLNRVFACLFEANNIITNITDIKITNFDDLLRVKYPLKYELTHFCKSN